MASISIEYNLEEAGWAVAVVENDIEAVNMTVSYLHDSLRELADAARVLLKGSNSAKVVFMDEPGEHHLIFTKTNDQIYYEVRWFEDWASWDMQPQDKYKMVLRGNSTLKRVSGEIFKVLKNIFDTHGVEKYKELWGEHDFPEMEFNDLKLLRGTEQGASH